MLYEFEFFRIGSNALEDSDKAPAIRRETREFAYQDAAELYGLRNTAPYDAVQKPNGFRLYAEGKLRNSVCQPLY
jgi:hypothetical protein